MPHKIKVRENIVGLIHVNGKPIRVTESHKYFHFIIKDPKKFKKIRTVDIGKKGGHQLKRGERRGKWETQSVLVEHHNKELGKIMTRESTKKILRKSVRG